MDNWEDNAWAYPVLPKPRPCEDAPLLIGTAVSDTVLEYWVDPDHHDKAMEPGYYSFFETLWPADINPPHHDAPFDGDGSFTIELLDASGGVLAGITMSFSIAIVDGTPSPYDFAAGEVDMSNAKPVATFNGVRFSADAAWKFLTGMLLCLRGRSRATIDGGDSP